MKTPNPMNTGHDLSSPPNASTVLTRVIGSVPIKEASLSRAQKTNRYLYKESLSSVACDADVNEFYRDKNQLSAESRHFTPVVISANAMHRDGRNQ